MTAAFSLFLQREFHRRSNANQQYSKRAFAKDLNVSKSCLHDLLAGKAKASRKTIRVICESLHLNKEDHDRFVEDPISLDSVINHDYLKVFHWYYFAILNLIETKDSNLSSTWFAERLGIGEAVVKDAIKDLIEFKFITKSKKKYIRLEESVKTQMDVPSIFIKSLHAENLKRAEESLFKDSVEDREMTSLTFAVDRSQFLKIKKENQKHRERIAKIVRGKAESDEVYTFAMQLFPQTIIKE